MARQKPVKLPNTLRNPLITLVMVQVLRDAAQDREKRAVEEGRQLQARPEILQIKAFAKELEDNANARLGDQLDGM